ncbi:hypothetical protein [Flavobacterium rivuli]|nr:hypothetical protein [Flavobacterium rivuli]
MRMFHVELNLKTLFSKGFLVFIMVAAFTTSCVKPQGTLEIQDYTLLANGKQILGHKEGLTAFMFENNLRKIAFQQFLADKYGVGSYNDVSYEVTVEDHKFKVFLYENAEIEKYFKVSQFMVTMAETEDNIKGSNQKFIALSIVNNSNEDCLTDGSLYQQVAIRYLKSLKDEFYNL